DVLCLRRHRQAGHQRRRPVLRFVEQQRLRDAPGASNGAARLYVVMRRRDLLAAERGTLHKEAETRVALVYPSPYRAAMSSLGYQQIYRVLHGMPGVAADRAMQDVPQIGRAHV